MTFYDDWSVTLTVHFGDEKPSLPVAKFLAKQGATYGYADGGNRVTEARIKAHDVGHATAYARAMNKDTPSLSFDIAAHYEPPADVVQPPGNARGDV